MSSSVSIRKQETVLSSAGAGGGTPSQDTSPKISFKLIKTPLHEKSEKSRPASKKSRNPHKNYHRSMTNAASPNRRLVPQKMLSIDTGIRGLLRRGQSLKARGIMNELGVGGPSPRANLPPGLQPIDENQDQQSAKGVVLPSPTKFIKESLRLHGTLIHDGSDNSNPQAYEQYVDANYQRNYLGNNHQYSHDIDMRSVSYSSRMHQLKERSIRHSNLEDIEQIYANDVSALKKLRIQENNQERLNRDLVPGGKRDENFAGQDNQRKAKKKPTASETRQIQKLFRRQKTNKNEDGGETPSIMKDPNFSDYARREQLNQSKTSMRQSDLQQTVARVSDLRQQLRNQTTDFGKKSPARTKIDTLKQKLPFLRDNNFDGSESRHITAENLDLDLSPMSNQKFFNSTVESQTPKKKGFQNKGLVLHETPMPGSPQPGKKQANLINTQDRFRMNLTQTHAFKSASIQEVLDQSSNVDQDDNVEQKVKISLQQMQQQDPATTSSHQLKVSKLESQNIDDNQVDLKAAPLVSPFEEADNHSTLEDPPQNTTETLYESQVVKKEYVPPLQEPLEREITLSEHGKGFFLENMEQRPIINRQSFQHPQAALSSVRGGYKQMLKREPSVKKNIQKKSSSPIVARLYSTKPQKSTKSKVTTSLRKNNSKRRAMEVAKSFDIASLPRTTKHTNDFAPWPSSTDVNTIFGRTEDGISLQESVRPLNSAHLDSVPLPPHISHQNYYNLHQQASSRVSRNEEAGYSEYQRGKLSKSINISTNASRLWHVKSTYMRNSQEKRQYHSFIKSPTQNLTKEILSQVEKRLKSNKPLLNPLMDKKQVGFQQLFSNQGTLPAVAVTQRSSPSKMRLQSNTKHIEMQKSKLLKASRKINFPETSRSVINGGAALLAKNESQISIPIFMLGTQDDLKTIFNRVSQRSLLKNQQESTRRQPSGIGPIHQSRQTLSLIDQHSQMYCPSVVDLNLPDPVPTSTRKPRKSSKNRVSPARVALNPPSVLSNREEMILGGQRHSSSTHRPVGKNAQGAAANNLAQTNDIVVNGVDVDFDEIRSAEELSQMTRQVMGRQSKTSSYGAGQTVASQEQMHQTYATELGLKQEGALDLSHTAQHLSLTLNDKQKAAARADGAASNLSQQQSQQSGSKISRKGGAQKQDGASVKGGSVNGGSVLGGSVPAAGMDEDEYKDEAFDEEEEQEVALSTHKPIKDGEPTSAAQRLRDDKVEEVVDETILVQKKENDDDSNQDLEYDDDAFEKDG